jgi:hypothetical protein
MTPLPDLPLWQFPIRSAAQGAAKGVVGWLANLAGTGEQQGKPEGFQ